MEIDNATDRSSRNIAQLTWRLAGRMCRCTQTRVTALFFFCQFSVFFIGPVTCIEWRSLQSARLRTQGVRNTRYTLFNKVYLAVIEFYDAIRHEVIAIVVANNNDSLAFCF